MNIPQQIRLHILCIFIAMIAAAAVGAFSIVWMQQQINQAAVSCQRAEREMEETLRRLRHLDERIASVLQPIALQAKVAGRLRPSMENQIVWVKKATPVESTAYASTRFSQSYQASLNFNLSDLQMSSR